MDEIVQALADQHAELDALVAGLDDAGWALPSRCPGWSVSDVLLHLAQTDEMALASLQGDLWGAVEVLAAGARPATDVDAGADAIVEAQRGAPGPEVHRRWRTSAADLREALAGADPHGRVQWVAGDLTCRTLATTRLSEAWIHTGDVGHGLGSVPPPTDRLRHVARLAWRTLPHAFRRAGRELGGPVAFHLTSPGGERWTFDPEGPAATVVRGEASELCEVAGQRRDARTTGLTGEGPDAEAVLELVRTFA